MLRRLVPQGFGAQDGPERRAGFLEIRRDSTAKNARRGSYPQGWGDRAGGHRIAGAEAEMGPRQGLKY